MATEKSTSVGGVGSSVGNDRMSAARAARTVGKSRTSGLGDREKYAMRQIQGARSALQKAQKGLLAGFDIPADLIDACAKINSAVGKMLFD